MLTDQENHIIVKVIDVCGEKMARCLCGTKKATKMA